MRTESAATETVRVSLGPCPRFRAAAASTRVSTTTATTPTTKAAVRQGGDAAMPPEPRSPEAGVPEPGPGVARWAAEGQAE